MASGLRVIVSWCVPYFPPMYQDGLRKAASGRTTVEEVLWVAAVSED